MSNNRQPDYVLKVFDKTNQARGVVGAGWSDTNGRISIKLNPGVALSYNNDLVISLFINDQKGPNSKPAGGNQYDDPFGDDAFPPS